MVQYLADYDYDAFHTSVKKIIRINKVVKFSWLYFFIALLFYLLPEHTGGGAVLFRRGNTTAI
jgi:hypothetical protein